MYARQYDTAHQSSVQYISLGLTSANSPTPLEGIQPNNPHWFVYCSSSLHFRSQILNNRTKEHKYFVYRCSRWEAALAKMFHTCHHFAHDARKPCVWLAPNVSVDSLSIRSERFLVRDNGTVPEWQRHIRALWGTYQPLLHVDISQLHLCAGEQECTSMFLCLLRIVSALQIDPRSLRIVTTGQKGSSRPVASISSTRNGENVVLIWSFITNLNSYIIS